MALVGKDQLVHEVAAGSGLEITEARRVLDETFRAIETQLGEGNEVRLTGFGKFSVSRRKAREGRNPQTGEPMRIAARKVPHFSAGTELRNAVPQGTSPDNEESSQNTRKPATGQRRGPKAPRRPATRRGSAPSEDEATRGSSGADEGEPVETGTAGKALSVAASGAKYALVVAGGLAAGVAGGLAITHRR